MVSNMTSVQEKFDIIGKKLCCSTILNIDYNFEYNQMILTCLNGNEQFLYYCNKPLEFTILNSFCSLIPPNPLKQLKIDEEIKRWLTLTPGLDLKCPQCKKELSFNAIERYYQLHG
ncbi:hypothetical protein GQ473_02075 [archaeon]|nr:hypothetical protein [archaeon]